MRNQPAKLPKHSAAIHTECAKKEKKESGNAMTSDRIFSASLVALGVLILCALPAFAQHNSTPSMTGRHAVGFAISPPLSEASDSAVL